MRFLILTLIASVAMASTSYTLPDPAVTVTPNWSNTTTIVTVAGVTYRGPSHFYYVSACAKADGPRYHCNVLAETDVVLTDSTGNTAVVSLTMQDASILIISGHNYWRQSQVVLNGDLSL